MFKKGEGTREVEQLLMVVREDRLERERQKWRGVQTDSRIYRNYLCVMIYLCRQYNSFESIPIFRKLFSLLVMSGLFFSHSAGGWHGS